MISYDITLISPPVVLAATALPRITSRLTKRIHMLHACYILHLVFGVFCIILCASVTFCHSPLGFCWEQRAFRLCTRQSSKLLFVFLRWGKEKNTMQQKMHKLMPCSSQQIQQIFKLKKSLLHFKVSCRNTPARCDYIEAPGESAKESGLTQEATDPETPVSWQAGPKFDQAKRQNAAKMAKCSCIGKGGLTLSSLSLWCHESLPTLFYCCIDFRNAVEKDQPAQ